MPNAAAFQIQMGQFTKATAGEVAVAFPEPFSVVPFVFLTPNYPGATINFVDSVVSVNAAGFTVNSPNCSNASGAYTISWLAITPAE